jgi:type I restriction enzyme R subunit
MLGRATRRCDDIGKEVFRIFDPVDLYSALAAVSTMKPVVADPKISFAKLVEALGAAKTKEVAQTILDQLLAKLQNKRRRLRGSAAEQFETAAGLAPTDLLKQLQQQTPKEAAKWFAAHAQAVALLDRSTGEGARFIISHHEDELRRVERGYGKGEKPQDYLQSFAGYLQANLNQIPALLIVTQRPRELTRQQLKDLRLVLDQAGYTETALQTAWRETTNQDLAASIIGFIRRAALGDALLPYTERVDRALKTLLSSRPWTDPQRKWLDRIGQQLRIETIVDREALDRGQFKTQGGYSHINKVFDGQLDAVLGDLHEALWKSAA